jgi:metallo-beta-lactamase class B
MNRKSTLNAFIVLIFFLFANDTFAQIKKETIPIEIAKDLEIIKLSDRTLLHISTSTSPQFGTYTSNGVIYIDGNEAVVLDTPPNDTLSALLLDWFEREHKAIKIKAIIVNHFHADALGGLKEFHKRGIQSYSTRLTAELALRDLVEVPQNTFDNLLELNVGKSKIINSYQGEAHSPDNIVTWIPKEKILFGGCMVKSLDASKGNLGDANQKEWPNTISRVKDKYKEAKIVIPGHGEYGGLELLDYTIRLFQ